MRKLKGLVLDLSRIGEGTTTFSEPIDLGELDVSWPGVRFQRQLELKLAVARSGHDLDVSIRFTGTREGECDRCLKPFQHSFAGTLRTLGRKADPGGHPLDGQDGVVFHDGRRLDLTAELRQAVLIDIPIRDLCSEDCRGLCSTCGADLNVERCVCTAAAVDPRWEALRKARQL